GPAPGAQQAINLHVVPGGEPGLLRGAPDGAGGGRGLLGGHGCRLSHLGGFLIFANVAFRTGHGHFLSSAKTPKHIQLEPPATAGAWASPANKVRSIRSVSLPLCL